MNGLTPRVAVVASHPIQYQAPWFRGLAAHVDLHVYFCHRQTAEGQAAAGFGQPFEWDVPLLDGYSHSWLANVSETPGVDRYRGCDTPDIERVLRAGAYDACIVSGWYLKSYTQAIRACWDQGTPILVRGDSQLAGPRRRMTTIAKYLPYRWFLRRINGHLYVGRANREYLEHYGVRPEMLFHAPHFVDNERFGATADAARRSGRVAALRTGWGAASNTTIFAFAGKLIEKKRPLDFLDAIARLAGSGADVCGLFVGSGPLQAEIEASARGRGLPVRFAGFQNQAAIPAYYAAADCLVLPSDGRETWGLVVNEAMACGLPAITSAEVGCARDLIDPGATGLTYPVGDVDALARRMAEMMELLRLNRSQVAAAVANRIAQYSCDAAVRGALAGLHAVTSPLATVRGTQR